MSADPSILSVLRGDIEDMTKNLRRDLTTFCESGFSHALFDNLILAAHSIRGAASVVKSVLGIPSLESISDLAHAMEDVFIAIKEERLAISPAQCKQLLEVTDFLSAISSLDDELIPEWLADNDDKSQVYIKTVSDIQKATDDKTMLIQNDNSVTVADNSDNVDLSDFSMMGLFKVEAETQSQILCDGLVALEETPSATKEFEPLMRAAHSLKGAARIVNLDPLVTLAHAMEDCLEAAMKHEITLNENHFDKLLNGVDIIKGISELSEEEFGHFVSENMQNIAELSSIYQDIKSGTFAEELQSEKEATAHPIQESTISTDRKTERRTASSKDGFVRVTTENLNRLLAIAGESLVQSRRMHSFDNAILNLKKEFSELAEATSSLCKNSCGPNTTNENTKELISDFIKRNSRFYESISGFSSDFSQFSLKSNNFSNKLYNEVLSCRLRPFEDGARVFPRIVRDIAKKLGKKVKFKICGKTTDVDRDILEKLEAPLNHLIRNALDHGIELPDERKKIKKDEIGSIVISASHWAGMLNISVADDGKGIDVEELRAKIIRKGLATEDMARELSQSELLEFLFLPGFSTTTTVTELSGRGVGLDVVQSMIQEVRGVVKVKTERGKGTTFHLQLPITLSVISTLLAKVDEDLYAFPLSKVDRLLTVQREEIQTIENHQFISYENSNIGLISANEILGYPVKELATKDIHVVVVSDRLNQYALIVDTLLDRRELVVRPLDARLGKLPYISAASVMDENGLPVLIVDVDDMVKSIDNLLKGGMLHNLTKADNAIKGHKRVLIVDDSITVRELEKSLLANRGYDVETAVDGADGWNALRTSNFDMVITDVDMPRMNGFELVEKIKAHEKFRDIPVMIVSYKDREEDRIRGIDAGAEYYLTKSSFHDNTLIDAVYDLIGDAVAT